MEAADRLRLIRAHERWRLGFVGLAILISVGLHFLFERQAGRLDALADHGRATAARVTGASRQDGRTYVEYAYSVEGVTYTWSVEQADAPYGLGETFTVIYLPESPSLTRPYAEKERAAAEASENRSFATKVIAGVFAFFAFNALLSEVKLRKLRGGRAAGLVVSPRRLGHIVASLILLVVVLTNFASDVATVQVKAFGAAPLGIPVAVFVAFVEVILFLPFFWVFEHLMRLVERARRDGGSLGKVGIAWYVLSTAKRHPELRRSRAIALGGLGYFWLLAGSWIAYAGSRGL